MHREASVCGQTTEIQIGIPYFLMSKMETWGLQESLVPWCSMALEWFWWLTGPALATVSPEEGLWCFARGSCVRHHHSYWCVTAWSLQEIRVWGKAWHAGSLPWALTLGDRKGAGRRETGGRSLWTVARDRRSGIYPQAPSHLGQGFPRMLRPCTCRLQDWAFPLCPALWKAESERDVGQPRQGAVRLYLLEASGHSKGCSVSWAEKV